MIDFDMTWLLRLLCWGFQIGILLLIAWVPTAFLAKSRRTGAVLRLHKILTFYFQNKLT